MGHPSPQRGRPRAAAQASLRDADLDGVSDLWARHGVARPTLPTSPYDAEAALESLLGRLRASAGATRVSIWVHEATTEMVLPFRQAVAATGEPVVEVPELRAPVTLNHSAFLSAV